MTAKAPKKLNPMARAFITAYIEDPEHNAKAAAIKAGYSAKTAQEQASRLLSFPIIKTEIETRLKGIEEKSDVTVARVLKELSHIAFVDVRECYGAVGGMLAVKQIPENVARAIASIETEELFEGVGQDRTRVGDTVKLRMNSKVSALELIGRHLKMFTDKVEHTFDPALFERLERARLNAKKIRK